MARRLFSESPQLASIHPLASILCSRRVESAFFYLFNMLAGEFSDGTMGRILLPLAPEYIGYADQGLVQGELRVAEHLIDVHCADTGRRV